MKGKVKWFNIEKRYGFIKGEDGKEYFIHQSSIQGADTLTKEEEVEFNAVKTERGIQANNLKKL